MEVIFDVRSPPVGPAIYMIGNYFQTLARDDDDEEDVGYDNLEDIRSKGGKKLPQDKHLWKIGQWRGPTGWTATRIVSQHDLKELQDTIRDLDARYPPHIRRELLVLETEIKRVMAKEAKKEARNILAANAAGVFRAGKNEEVTAFNRIRGQPFFISEVAKFLTGQPRATRESRGGIGPVIRNLRQISRGEHPAPIRNNKTRRNRSRSRSRSRSRNH
jgi:hypothetical protein